MAENDILRRVAELAGMDISFLDEKELPGTATLDGFPLDIEIVDYGVLLVGAGGSGNSTKLSKSIWRGKGRFRQLAPHFRQALIEFGYQPELFLIPISPAWSAYQLTFDPTHSRWKIIL